MHSIQQRCGVDEEHQAAELGRSSAVLLGLEGQETSCKEQKLLCSEELHLTVPKPLLAVDLHILSEAFG